MTEAVERRVMGFLGICMRAGQLVSGQEACVDAIRRETAKLALLDVSASPNTRKRICDACMAHHLPLYEVSAEMLGHCIGKSGRMVVTLGQGSMAEHLLKLLENEQRL